MIVDTVDEEGAITRSHWDAPEIDGNVFLEGETGLKPGDRLMVTVEEANEYDLWGSPVTPTPASPPIAAKALAAG